MKVQFLCSGNSCRSQMAEAIVNHDRELGWQAYSAGTRPTGFVHPLALQVLNELGIRHEGYSKSVDEFRSMAFDLVITVCDTAAEECPVWLRAGKRLHRTTQKSDTLVNILLTIRSPVVKNLWVLL